MTTAPTMPETPAGAAEVAATLAGLQSVITQGAALVRAGEMVDLGGLEREAKAILDAVLALPPFDARAMLPALDGLLSSLDALAASLTDVHGDTLGGRETHSTRIRAAVAYRKAEEP